MNPRTTKKIWISIKVNAHSDETISNVADFKVTTLLCIIENKKNRRANKPKMFATHKRQTLHGLQSKIDIKFDDIYCDFVCHTFSSFSILLGQECIESVNARQ